MFAVTREGDNRDGAPTESPREMLIHRLRNAMMQGVGMLRLLNDLRPVEDALLTAADKKQPKDDRKAFAPKKEAA